MHGARKRSLRAAVAAAGLAALTPALEARAQVAVSVRYESDDQLEVARRITSELSSEGYAVEIVAVGTASPCDPDGTRVVAVPERATVWIRLAADPARNDAVVASICYLGTLPFLQRASVPKSDSSKLKRSL